MEPCLLCDVNSVPRGGGTVPICDTHRQRYFELNTGWTPQPIGQATRLRAFRLPSTRFEPAFEAFKKIQLAVLIEGETSPS
jgi:hypothetical protein